MWKKIEKINYKDFNKVLVYIKDIKQYKKIIFIINNSKLL